MDVNRLYQFMCRIRFFEEMVLERFPSGVFVGTTHTYLGQEANAVGVISHLQAGDIIFSNHRGHGHFLACGGEPRALFAELMGKANGLCGGRGGSQHLQWNNFYSNGVQGGIVPIASGMAFAEKIKGSGAIAVAFLGDGTMGEGVIYEAFNMASKWQIPILYVVENNRIAQTTPIELTLAGSIAQRFQAFGISYEEMDSSDVVQIYQAAEKCIAKVRQDQSPIALIIHTYRFGPHSKGDDTRPPADIARLRETFDPMVIHASRLSPADREAIEREERELIRQAFENALADEFPSPLSSPTERDGEMPLIREGERRFLVSADPQQGAESRRTSSKTQTDEEVRELFAESSFSAWKSRRESPTVLQSLNNALHQALAADERVFLLGQDLLDPYGGAFKVTQGCSTRYPERVIPTPISEAGLVGMAAGMALRGLLPVAEIMFGDFLTLIADQVINHIAKFRWMYNEKVRVPLVIRTPMGGGRGYGPTHSQSLEKIYLGIPGIHVVAVSHFGDPQDLLLHAIFNDDEPLIFVEHKNLYPLNLMEGSDPDFEVESRATSLGYPIYTLRFRHAPPAQLTIIAYSYTAELARRAMLELAVHDEIFCELVVPTQLSPYTDDGLLESAKRYGKVLVVEEGSRTLGWGAEVLARLAEQLFPHPIRLARLAAADHPIPASPPLEKAALPSVQAIVRKAKDLI